jgi:hypothetical protein
MKERMGPSLRAAVMTLIASLLLPVDVHAQAQQQIGPPPPSPIVAGADLVILRPLGLVAMADGAVLFVPAALLTAPNGLDSVQMALNLFVSEPAKSVFQRPLGDF